ncbi:hypothetical protein KJ733_05265 [Patescibacteria group bacterium]|nr:hypothetical protein [Patescibacteria group bacterium]MBU1952290.1 hypothetical protein [Patescibacteria group bacterium]
MKIYIGHSSSFNYKKELYDPIKESSLFSKHEFILPHDNSSEATNSKELIKTIDLLIAEVSYPSTGLGIELGWANYLNCPIICIYKKDSAIPNSLKILTNRFIEYSSAEELIKKLEKELE